MSLNLYSEPIVTVERTQIGAKRILCRAFGESDGSLHEEFVLTHDHLRELRMLDAVLGEEGSEITQAVVHLITEIETHGAVRVYTAE